MPTCAFNHNSLRVECYKTILFSYANENSSRDLQMVLPGFQASLLNHRISFLGVITRLCAGMISLQAG